MRSRAEADDCGGPDADAGQAVAAESAGAAVGTIPLAAPGWRAIGLGRAADVALGEGFAAAAPAAGVDAASAAAVGARIRASLDRAAESGVRFAAVLARTSPEDGAVVAGLTLAVVCPGDSGDGPAGDSGGDRPSSGRLADRAPGGMPVLEGDRSRPGSSVVLLPCGPAVRTEYFHDTDLDGLRLSSLVVRYMVGLPETGGVVVLSFSTRTVRCRDALCREFAQIAESVRFDAQRGG